MSANNGIAHRINRIAGTGGHVTYEVDVASPNGFDQQLTFSGNIFVGPVILTGRDEHGRGYCVTVAEPRRYGEFVSADWVSRFLETWQRDDVSDLGGMSEQCG